MSTFNWTDPKTESYQEFFDRLPASKRRSILKQKYQAAIDAAQKIADQVRAVEAEIINHPDADGEGNLTAETGCDRCDCGCKYWEFDQCVDCGADHRMEPW